MAPLYHTADGPQDDLRRPRDDRRSAASCSRRSSPSGGNSVLLVHRSLCSSPAPRSRSAEVATYPARLKERSIRRAAEYGRVRDPGQGRRAAPASASACSRRPLQRLAAIPLKLNPTHERRGDRRPPARGRARAARDARVRSSRSRAAASSAAALLGLVLAAIGLAVRSASCSSPMLGAVGFIGPGHRSLVTDPQPPRRDPLPTCRTHSTCSPSASRPVSASTARSRS